MTDDRLRRPGGRRRPLVAWGWGACLLAVLTLTGCQAIKAAGYWMAPKTEKVAAEYNKLPGKKVVVYAWAPPEVLWDYPKLRLDLAAYLSAYLQKHVKNVTVVDPVRVEAFIEQRNAFELSPLDVGREFKADAVVHLSVYQFSVRDPEMAHFYRGRVGASVVVHDLANAEAPERVALQDVKVAVPEQGPVGFDRTNAVQIRQATYDAFTVQTGQKFHEWERALD